MITVKQLHPEHVPVIFKIIEDAEKQLSDLIGGSVRLSVSSIKDVKSSSVLEYLKVVVPHVAHTTWQKVNVKSRKREIVIVRQMYCFVAFTDFRVTCTQIAKSMGQDHTTVLYAVRFIKTMLEINDELVTGLYSKVKQIIVHENKTFSVGD